MHQIKVSAAKKELVELVEAAIRGESVIILTEERHGAQLAPVEPPCRRPQFGSARGMVLMADDFDAPPADFGWYMQ